MKYKCCEYLLHQIVFDQFDIKPCCSTSMNAESAMFVSNFDGKDFDFQKYISQRTKYIEIFKKGEIPACCEGCPVIQEKEWDDNEYYFDRIIMANIAKCSCNCVYCVYTHDNPDLKKFYNTKNSYDIKPLLLKLRKYNLLKENFVLIIGGGECSEFPKGELEWLIYFTAFYNGRVQILSSGIRYSNAIELILKSGNVELSISPDSGTKETYEKIKRVKAFDNVWNNLKNYIKASKNNENARVEIKYIIIPGFNDNIQEVEKFIYKCKEVNCRNIHIDIEHYWYKDNKDKPVSDNMKQVINIFKQTKEIDVSYSVETENWIKVL